MSNRRDFLKKTGLLSGAIALQNVLPHAIQKAVAISPDPGTTFYDAEHIVFLMQENRSFDHMFGKLKGVRGFNDPHPHILPNGNKVWLQSDKNGNVYAPFRIDLNKTRVTWQGGLAHSWPDQIAARNKGKYDKWVPVKSAMCLAHYEREDIPFYYALADAFAVCDQHFCSSLTGTTPNRLFYWTGNIRADKNGTDKAVVNNSQAESRNNVFIDWQTFPEVLEDNGIDWRVYQNEVWTANLKGETDDWLGNYGDNALEYVKRHNVKLSAYFRKNGDKTSNPPLTAEEVEAKYQKLSPKEKNLIDRAFTTNINHPDYLALAPFSYKDTEGKTETLNIPKGDIFYQFRKDVNEGKLPMVSWLVAPQRFSDHTSSPLYGVWYVSEALNILTQNPEVWKKTIFIVNYDENDGYFDHIPPYVVPETGVNGKVSEGIDTRSDFEKEAGSPIGLGYRVPMVVASPWSRGGFVNSQIFDHTSTLMFLEKFIERKTGKAVKSDMISSWRRNICGDLTSVFKPYHGEKTDKPQPLVRDQVLDHIQQLKSKPKQNIPASLSSDVIHQINTSSDLKNIPEVSKQEKGFKLACALPYHLKADAALNAQKNKLIASFETLKYSSGVPFNVSAQNTYNGEQGANWYYAVKSGDKLTDSWNMDLFDQGKYELSVQSANGFYRKFKGNQRDPDLIVICDPTQNNGSGKSKPRLSVNLFNEGKQALKVQIYDDKYHTGNNKVWLVKPKSNLSFEMDLKSSSGWYNFKIKAEGFETYLRHYAGHIETGSDSITDPLMAYGA